MTETENTTTAPESDSAGLPGESGTPEPDSGQEHTGGKLHRENGRYRTERNQAREELAAAQERMQQLQTRELHRLAGEYLAAPEDISLSGKDLGDFLTPEGWVDHEAVVEAVQEIISSRPGLAKNLKQPAFDPTQGLGSPTPKHKTSFSDLFKS